MSSSLVASIHHLLAQHRVNLSALATALEIPLATLRRVTAPATAPTPLCAWESLMQAVGAVVSLEYAGKRYPVPLPDLHQARMQEVHHRLVERLCLNRTLGPSARSQKMVTTAQAQREVQALRRTIETAITQALPPGTHHTTSIFAPAAAMITGVAAMSLLGRSYENLELVTGISGRSHRLLCTPDEQRPMAILQSALALVGIVVVVDCEAVSSTWVIGQAKSTPTAFQKATNQRTGAARGAPAHEHLPLAKSQILTALLGERSLAPTLISIARSAGVSAGSLAHWERRQRDPTLEALEALAAALGGAITLGGRISRRLTPAQPTRERLEQAFHQTCSSYRWSVGRATGLTDDALRREIARRVESTRSRVVVQVQHLPAMSSGSLVDWIRARRAGLQAVGHGSVLELSLISGLNRGSIDRILLDDTRLDAPYLTLLNELGMTPTIETQAVRMAACPGAN